jgi:hypothetical protein
MKKIIIVGDAKHHLIAKYGIKHECFILANDNVSNEAIRELIENNNIIDNPIIVKTINIKEPVKEKYSRQSKKWLPNYKYHK